MRLLVQRVKQADVTVDQKEIGKIEQGFLVFIGVSHADTEASDGGKEIAQKMVKKLIGLRIFEDAQGKTNLDLQTVGGGLLLISQFTLYADCHKGNRPSFIGAGAPDKAKELYEYIITLCKQTISKVETGSFGAEMKVSLLNDGPFTILLDSDEICR